MIKPATEKQRTSFVELVAFAAQLPDWFVSHWWGEPVFDFVACIEQHVQDHTEKHNYDEEAVEQSANETGYWVCAYANNQWRLDEELVDDLSLTSFRKALALAKGAVSILDRGGKVFTRVWCCYEIYIALAEAGDALKYEVYTAENHTYKDDEGWKSERAAVGMTDGLAPADLSAEYKELREVHFPLKLAKAAFETKLEIAEASKPADRNRILNTISGRAPAELLEPPLAAHAEYDGLNAKLRGRFGLATLAALLKAGESIDRCLEVIKNSRINKLVLNFKSVRDLPSFDEAWTRILGSLPEGMQSLDLGQSELGDARIGALAAALPKYRSLVTLRYAQLARYCASCQSPLTPILSSSRAVWPTMRSVALSQRGWDHRARTPPRASPRCARDSRAAP